MVVEQVKFIGVVRRDLPDVAFGSCCLSLVVLRGFGLSSHIQELLVSCRWVEGTWKVSYLQARSFLAELVNPHGHIEAELLSGQFDFLSFAPPPVIATTLLAQPCGPPGPRQPARNDSDGTSGLPNLLHSWI